MDNIKLQKVTFWKLTAVLFNHLNPYFLPYSEHIWSLLDNLYVKVLNY